MCTYKISDRKQRGCQTQRYEQRISKLILFPWRLFAIWNMTNELRESSRGWTVAQLVKHHRRRSPSLQKLVTPHLLRKSPAGWLPCRAGHRSAPLKGLSCLIFQTTSRGVHLGLSSASATSIQFCRSRRILRDVVPHLCAGNSLPYTMLASPRSFLNGDANYGRAFFDSIWQ